MIDHDTRAGRLAWLRANVQHGYAGRPGTSPGQPFQPGAITGGLEGPTVRCSIIAELRAALDLPTPAWVVWTGTGVQNIRDGYKRERITDGRLIIQRDNKTLISGGLPLGLVRNGLRIDRAMNVVVSGVSVGTVKGDAFEISESRVIALHACSAGLWTDGAFDIVRGSTDVLLKGCHIVGSGKAKKGCLIGADDRPFVFHHHHDYAHLGLLDDRHTRVTLDGCTFENVAVRTPLVRHGRVVLVNHRIIGGGKGPLVEARTGGRILWESGEVVRAGGRPVVAASYRSQDTVTPGRLYVAPAVRLNGATVQANWTPTAAEAMDMLRMRA